ncbi:MAG TPA: VanZ family protein, partial [Steroidobacteraceae bacterium]|nr:VanZ family protein [Steroidobacteraceae bacterium]
CAFLLLESRRSTLAAGALAVLAGSLLSLGIEIGQVYVSPRVPSLMDLALNTAGTLAGALAGAGWRSLGGFVYVPQSVQHSGPAALAVVVTWIAARLPPFAFEIDLGKLKAALAPLARPELSVFATLRYLVSWLVVTQALFALIGRERGLDALLALIAAALVGRLVIATQALVPAELLALVLLLPGLVVLNGMRQTPRTLLLFAAVTAILCGIELAPLELSAHAATFDFWPFLGWIDAGYPFDAAWLLDRLFLYAALFWLLRELGPGTLASGIALTGVVLAIEIVQIWRVAGTPAITQPAIAVLLAAMVHAFDRPRRRFR